MLKAGDICGGVSGVGYNGAAELRNKQSRVDGRTVGAAQPDGLGRHSPAERLCDKGAMATSTGIASTGFD